MHPYKPSVLLFFGAILSALLLASTAGSAAASAPKFLAADAVVDPDIRAELESRLTSGSEVPLSGADLDAARDAYASRNYSPIWTGSRDARDRAEELLREVAQADLYALNPASYELSPVRRALEAAYSEDAAESGDVERLADLELHLTHLFLDFGRDLAEGPFDPSSVGASWHVEEPEVDVAAALTRVADGDPIHVLTGLASQHESYRRLQSAIEEYRDIERQGGFPHVPPGDLVRPSESSPRVIDLHERLEAEDYDAGRVPSDSLMHDQLASALADFQRAHGLAVDSILGPNTLSELNVPASERVLQMQTNLVRWHWMPVDLGGRYVFVNLPEYRLYAYEDGDPVLSMAVVVGAEYDQRATPAFSDRITYAEFRPYWNVPTSIAAEELVPRGAADLADSGFEIVPRFGVSPDETLPMTEANLQAVARGEYFLRERPRPTNALGKVKYMFPNDFAIYLHDTPEDHLFEERERAFSHGCIRVEDPPALGAFLFQNRGWSEEEIERRMNEGPSSDRVDLREPVPVFILYFTAFIDENGRANFRPDLYGYDQPIQQALAARDLDEPEVDVDELIALLP